MALPSPSAGAASGESAASVMRYLEPSLKEAITTGFKTAALSGFGAQKYLEQSPILKMLGGGAISEMLEFRKRNIREKQGRDPNTGRKLTKAEIDEINSRRASYGVMGRIEDYVKQIYFFLESGGGPGGPGGKPTRLRQGANGKQVVVEQPKDTEGYALQAEEAAIEKEKEDDKDQLESEERQQSFFTKLFSKKDEKDKGGGLLGMLLGALGGLTSILKNTLGFLTGPFMKLFSMLGLDKLATNLLVKMLPALFKAIVPLFGSLFSALTPILAVAAGPLIALALAGAAGVVIASYIDKKTEAKERAAKSQMSKGIKPRYKVEESPGKFALKTAEELGTTDEAISEMAAKSETGEIQVGDKKLNVSDKVNYVTVNGKITDTLSDVNSDRAKSMADEFRPAKMPAIDMPKMAESATPEQAAGLSSELTQLNNLMSRYDTTFANSFQDIENEQARIKLVDGWNEVQKKAVEFMKKAEQTNNPEIVSAAAAQLDALTNTYGPFEDMFAYDSVSKKGIFAAREARQEAAFFGLGTGKLIIPSVEQKYARNKALSRYAGQDYFGNRQYVVDMNSAAGLLNSSGASTPPKIPQESTLKTTIPSGGLSTPPIIPPTPDSGIPAAANENAELKGQPSAANTNISAPTVVQQNNSNTGFSMPVSARINGDGRGDVRQAVGSPV